MSDCQRENETPASVNPPAPSDPHGPSASGHVGDHPSVPNGGDSGRLTYLITMNYGKWGSTVSGEAAADIPIDSEQFDLAYVKPAIAALNRSRVIYPTRVGGACGESK